MSFQAQVFGIAQRDTVSITFFQPPHGILLICHGKAGQSEEQMEMPTCMKNPGETEECEREKKGLHAGQGHDGEPSYG